MGGRGAKFGGGGQAVGATLNDPRDQYDNYTPQERQALYDYTKSSHINYELGVVGYDNMSDYYKNMTKQLDKAIGHSGWNETQTNTPFMRGGGGIMIGVPENMSFNSPQAQADWINQNLIGTTTTNKGYTSITTDNSVARGFTGGKKNKVILEYKQIEKGTKGAYVSGGNGKIPISYFGAGEDETLMQRNVKTTVIGSWVGKDGFVHVAVTAKGG